MRIRISTNNSKLGYQIPSISLPPSMSCRPDAPCARGCYGKKGNFLYKNVQESYRANYDLYKEDPKGYFDEVAKYLTGGLVSYKYFRWHAVGDIVDDEYFRGIVRVACECPGVRFLCFTKRFDIVNAYISNHGSLPHNLRVVFSAWSRAFRVDNPHNLPVAYVFFRNEKLNPKIPDLAIPCGGSCPDCLACWDLRDGQAVVFDQH